MFDFLNFTIVDTVDIVLVALVIYLLIRWFRGSSAMNIILAIIILVVVRFLAEAIGMKMTSAMLGAILDVGALAIIIIFQPEIRRFLGSIGRKAGNSHIFSKFFRRGSAEGLGEEEISELVLAVEQMARQKVGALIVVRRRDNLQSVIATGDEIDARISERLIENIFFKNSPLHDGAMVIGDNHIIAARCTLPITERLDIPPQYGMRHRAAIGLSEQCDADIIVVSEETGGISYVSGGELDKMDTATTLKLKLHSR